MTNGSVLPSMVGFFFISSRVDAVALGRKTKLQVNVSNKIQSNAQPVNKILSDCEQKMALFHVISNGFSLVKYPKEKASNRILTKVLVRKVYDQLWV